MLLLNAKNRKSARKLTAKIVDHLLRAGEPGRHVDHGDGRVKGLLLDITSPSAASWVLRYQRQGRTRHMGLGSAFEFNLGEARARAKPGNCSPMASIRSRHVASSGPPSQRRNVGA